MSGKDKIILKKRAIPMSVTTRGVGIAAGLIYDSCKNKALNNNMTIHELYRVFLNLFHFKVHLAQQIQFEPVTLVENPLENVWINDRKRQILQSVSFVPVNFAIILQSLGKVTVNQKIYHCGYFLHPEDEQTKIRSRPLTLNPDNIKEVLELIANPDTPEEERKDFINHCTIPGARFENNLLKNLEEVWPEGTDDQLEKDVRTFKNWISTVQTKQRKEIFTKIEWTGVGRISMLWSSARLKLRIDSTFGPGQIANIRTKRTAAGKLVKEMVTSSQRPYVSSEVEAENEWQSFWSKEETCPNGVIGIAILVGEECGLITRREHFGAYKYDRVSNDMLSYKVQRAILYNLDCY